MKKYSFLFGFKSIPKVSEITLDHSKTPKNYF